MEYIVITPVRDEVHFVEKTIASVAKQTVLPSEWVIVDDGSTDGTSEVLDGCTEKYKWIKVVHRQNRGYRAAGGGVIEAFYEGYSKITIEQWDYIVKLDGDLSFELDYFKKCFQKFADSTKLGIAGGLVCAIEGGKVRADSAGDPNFHVRGATKIYRRACWEKINPLVRAPGWDTIDEVKANMIGYNTCTFNDLILIQHKPTGIADGYWRNYFKNGIANYNSGYHPLFMMAKCLKRMMQKPIGLVSLALWAGYSSGYLRRVPMLAERDVIKYLQKQQIRRLLLQPSIYR